MYVTLSCFARRCDVEQLLTADARVIAFAQMRALELDWCHYEYLGDQYSSHIAQRIILQPDLTDPHKQRYRSLTVARLDSSSKASAMRHVARWSFEVGEEGLRVAQ